MRNYEHVVANGQILLPDHKSAKAAYGLHSKEYLDKNNPHFLREGTSTITNRTIYQLTEPSDPIATDGNFAGHGEGWIAVEERGANDFHFEHGMHKDKAVWK